MKAHNKVKIFLLALFLLVALFASASFIKVNAYNLPDMGSHTDLTLSRNNEKLLGEYIYSDIRTQLPIIENPFLVEYIQKLGNKLLKNSNSHYENFTFFIVNSSVINAFALPGGYIGVNKGLITAADSEAEIAAVLAHEIAHVNQRHIARSFEQQQNMQIPMLAGIIAGALLSAYNPDIGRSVMIGSMAAGNQSVINYTRSHEMEADRIGMQTLIHSGYPATSMVDFFQKLNSHSQIESKLFPEYLRTHPLNENRISDARARAIKLKPYPVEIPKNQMSFTMAKNILLIESTDNFIQAANKNLSASKNPETSEAQKHHYLFNAAYAYIKQHDYNKANNILSVLNKKFPYDDVIAATYAKSFNEDKDAAIKILEKQLKKSPNSVPLNLHYSKLVSTPQKTKQAISNLKNIKLTQEHYNPEVDLILAASYNKIGKKWHASMAYSDYSISIGDYKSALMQLRATAKFDKLNAYQTKILNYKIKKLEHEYKQREERIKKII